MTSGGGFLNPPCTNVSEPKVHVTEIRFSETEFYRFKLNLNMFGFGSAIAGGCEGTVSFSQIGGVPGAVLTILDSTSVFWGNFSDQVQYSLFDDRIGLTYVPEDVRLTTIDSTHALPFQRAA